MQFKAVDSTQTQTRAINRSPSSRVRLPVAIGCPDEEQFGFRSRPTIGSTKLILETAFARTATNSSRRQRLPAPTDSRGFLNARGNRGLPWLRLPRGQIGPEGGGPTTFPSTPLRIEFSIESRTTILQSSTMTASRTTIAIVRISPPSQAPSRKSLRRRPQ